jgi:glycerol dehydrogenase-like iron-containing ADH family enzyme
MKKAGNPDVVIFMGSDSDWSVMARAATVLEEFGVTHEAIVSSAHRTHDRTVTLVKRFTARGTQVFIAGAGAAAHLAGALAAVTPRPVIGVPLASSPLAGFDSLLSTPGRATPRSSRSRSSPSPTGGSKADSSVTGRPWNGRSSPRTPASSGNAGRAPPVVR